MRAWLLCLASLLLCGLANAADLVPASAVNLVISEIMYRPPAPTGAEQGIASDENDFEFIEFFNISSNRLDLTGVALRDGISFNFSGELASKAFLLVVRNREAFELRYGTNLPVAGEYSSRLANEGEVITLLDARGTNIVSLFYQTGGAWPSITVAGGSIDLINPLTNPNASIGTNWMKSPVTKGTPGHSTDTDEDGLLDAWELQFFDNLTYDGHDDPDQDQVINSVEFRNKTNPQNSDTDQDGLSDKVETNTGTWVNSNDTGTSPIMPDTDLDNLNDNVESNTGVFVSEQNTGTDPLYWDTDRDGHGDGIEVRSGSNPFSIESMPIPPSIVYFNISNQTNIVGDSITFSWSVSNAHAVFLEGIEVTNHAGTTNLTFPVGVHSYTLSASNGYTTRLATLSFRVFPDSAPVIQTFRATPAVIGANGSALLTWTVDGIVDELRINQGVGVVDGNSHIIEPGEGHKLIPKGSLWKYWDEKSDPGNWMQPGYDDSHWPMGPGPLGYGENGLTTYIRFGDDPSGKWPAAFFRGAFIVTNAAQYQRIVLWVKRDDGVQVWLNGQEVVRDNMPAGLITYQTLATTNAADDGRDYLEFPLSSELLLEGLNSIAVGVHQLTRVSADLQFDLELEAIRPGITPITYTLTASNGAGSSSASTTVFVRPEIEELVSFFDQWWYDESGTNLASGWTNLFFNDFRWASGFGVFGKEDRGTARPLIQTPLQLPDQSGTVTVLFRTYFKLPAHLRLEEIASLRLTYLIDDGAVVYLNGQELHRLGTEPGNPGATRILGDTDFEGPYILPPVLLSQTNILAVELNQPYITTTDIVFALRLETVATNSLAIPFSISRHDEQLLLMWDVPELMRLESAPSVTGPWTPVSAVPGQFVALPEEAAAFYRLQSIP